jgi:hypothetical protein
MIWLDEPDEDDEDEVADFQEAHESLKSLITEGIASNSNKEKNGLVCATYTVARHAAAKPQPWEDTDDEQEWSWQDLYDLSEELDKRLNEEQKALFGYLTGGRALFGKGFSDDGGWYAYLFVFTS